MSHILILGAGPAGIAAARTITKFGLQPTVIEESNEAGGQVYRRTAITAVNALWHDAARFHADLHTIKAALNFRANSFAWALEGRRLFILAAGACEQIDFDALIIATGATDRVFPFAGWNAPGVFTLGGAQIALKQGCSLGERVTMVGTGPLLYLLAYQYLQLGLRPAAVLDTGSPVPSVATLVGLAGCASMAVLGLRYLAKVAGSGIPFYRKIVPIGARSGSNRATEFVFRDAPGDERVIDCDAIAFGYGLRSETQMFSLAGCEFGYDEIGRQWLPELDDERRTSRDGIYAAGDCAGILGAQGAEASGELAALAALGDLGIKTPPQRLMALKRRIARLRRFQTALALMFPPPTFTRETPADLVICRCEGVTAGAIRRSVHNAGTLDINRIKAVTRVGMGVCQSRYCQIAAAEIVANTADSSREAVGRIRPQPPLKPIPLSINPVSAP